MIRNFLNYLIFHKTLIISRAVQPSLKNLKLRLMATQKSSKSLVTSIAWLALIISLFITLVSWYQLEQIATHTKISRFHLHTERLKTAIFNRLTMYEQMLRGAGVFAAHNFSEHNSSQRQESDKHGSVAEEWQNYIRNLQVDKHYPGVQGIGLGQWVPADQLENYIIHARTVGKFPEYTVRPAGEREAYVPVLLVEPLNQKNIQAIGFDMYSEPERRKAIQYAKTTGNMAITSKLRLIFDKAVENKPGFLMYLPIYSESVSPPHSTTEERQAALLGFVYASFRMRDLMRGIFGNLELSNIDFEIYDGTEMNDKTFMYDDSGEDEILEQEQYSLLSHSESFSVGGHTWTLRFTELPDFEQEYLDKTPSVLLISGIFISLLLFFLTRSRILMYFNNQELRAEVRERQIVMDKLSEREQILRLVIDNIPQLIFWKDKNSVYLGCNQGMARMAGLNHPDETIGKTDFELAWRNQATSYRAKDREVMSKGVPELRFREPITDNTGNTTWVETNKIPLHDTEGKVVGILGTSEDITERLRAEQLFKEYSQRLESEIAEKTKALRASEERFSLAMLGASDGLWDWNLQNNTIYFSPRWKEMIGFGENEVPNEIETCFNRIHPDDFPSVQQLLSNYMYKKVPTFEIIFRMQHKQGYYVWILSRAIGVWQQDELVRLVGTHVDISTQKATEQRLLQQEQFLRLVIDNIPQLVYWKDLKGNYIGCNRALANLLKLPCSGIIGCTDDDLYPSDLAKKFQQSDRQVIQSGLPKLGIETALVEKKDTVLWFETNKIPLRDTNGNIIGVLGTSEDITERRRAEQVQKEYSQRLEQDVELRTQELLEKTQLLEKEQEKFTVIMDSLELLVYVVDLKSYELLFVNQYARQRHEAPLVGQTCWKVLHHDKVEPCHFCTNDKLLTPEGEPKGTYTWEHHNEHQNRWFYIQDRAIHWTDGRLVRFEVATEITELKKVEAALQHSERRFRQLHESLQDGVVAISSDGKFIEFNTAFQQIVGYTADELYQLTYEQLTPECWHELEHKIIQEQVLTQGYSEQFEKEYLRKDGVIIPVELRVYLNRDRHGKPASMWKLVRDITERKQTEIVLIQAKEIAEQARFQADVANQAKSSFLANMSHELRTPLNGILGYAQILLRDKTLTKEQHDGLGVINRSGEYLLTLINDVLDLAKVEAGRVELYPVDFHFSEFLESIVELFKMRATQKNIAFNYEPLSILPEGVYADEKRLRQVLINLLGNAVKFTKKGGVTLKVGYDKQDRLRFQVEDTGIGISAEEIQKIFEPFQQVGDQRYRAEGTGLGLSITKKLVEMMGGELHVHSELGKGSTFWITLALPETKNLVKSHLEEHPIIIGYCYPRNGEIISQGLKVLVVDDRWENRSIVVKILETLGFMMYEAGDGAEGLQQAIEIKPDLIFTDLVMPILDGFELARQLRKLPEFNSVPIIAASASVFDYHQQESFAAGCNAFIPKPIRIDTMLELIQQQLPGLEWIEEYEEAATEIAVPVHEAEPTFLIEENGKLSVVEARKLYELGMIGDIESIFAEIDQLQKNAKLGSLVKQLTFLANDFKLEQICELMKSYME